MQSIYEWVKAWDITPMPKPRQTRADKWQKRDVVLRYRAFCDECKYKRLIVPKHNAHVIFVMPMPPSWSNAKRKRSLGRPHTSQKDVDNMIKSILDATYTNDKEVWDIRATKVWGDVGQIIIGKTLDNPLQMYQNMLDYMNNKNEV